MTLLCLILRVTCISIAYLYKCGNTSHNGTEYLDLRLYFPSSIASGNNSDFLNIQDMSLNICNDQCYEPDFLAKEAKAQMGSIGYTGPQSQQTRVQPWSCLAASALILHQDVICFLSLLLCGIFLLENPPKAIKKKHTSSNILTGLNTLDIICK